MRCRRCHPNRSSPSPGSRATRSGPRRARRRRPRSRLGAGRPASHPSARSSGTSPCSPLVATTRTTRPSSAAPRAIVPPVEMHSSSGCAWRQTRVPIGEQCRSSTLGVSHRPGFDQGVDALGCHAPGCQHVASVLTGPCRGRRDFVLGATESRRGCGLDDAGDLDEGLALDVVRMLGRFGHRQHRREADVGVLHDLAPLVAGLREEHLAQPLLQRWPGRSRSSRAWRTARRPRAR